MLSTCTLSGELVIFKCHGPNLCPCQLGKICWSNSVHLFNHLPASKTTDKVGEGPDYPRYSLRSKGQDSSTAMNSGSHLQYSVFHKEEGCSKSQFITCQVCLT